MDKRWRTRGNKVVYVPGPQDTPEALEAQRQIIPNLIAALELIIETIGPIGAASTDAEIECVEIARAAIRAAKGEA